VINQERIKRKRQELYNRVRRQYPDLFERAVNIGSLVVLQQHKDALAVAADVEVAVMNLIDELLDD